MNIFDCINKPLWFMAILLTAFVVACGGNSILGGAAVDLIRPRVTVTVPVAASTNHAANAALTAILTEAMAPATITTTSFTLATSAVPAVPVAGSVTYIAASRTARFKPTANLTVGTDYTATLTTAATDLAGNALAGNQAALPAASDYVWSFTAAAADATAPLITLTIPASGAAAAPLNSNVTATFDEAMDPATLCDAANLSATCPAASFTLATSAVPAVQVMGVVTYASNIATFNPSSNLAPSTSYTATVTSTATDLAGNALVVPAVGSPGNPWTFTTAAAVVPLAITLGNAETYGIAAYTAMTSTGATVINGNVALSPANTCTDATGGPGSSSQSCLFEAYGAHATGLTVNGAIRFPTDSDAGATAAGVMSDLTAAWTEGFSKVETFAPGFLVGQLAGKTLLPGVYNEANLGLSASGVATFDAQNDANAIFIIKVGTIGGTGDFTDSGTLLLPSQIVLANQAQARNIWFVVGRDITIGSGTTWNGNILAGRDATIKDGSTVEGRVLGGAGGVAGAIVLTGAAPPSLTTITVP